MATPAPSAHPPRTETPPNAAPPPPVVQQQSIPYVYAMPPMLPPPPQGALYRRSTKGGGGDTNNGGGGGGGYKTMDNSLDTCSRCCRILFLLLVLFSFLISYMALISCDFLEYRLRIPPPIKIVEDDDIFTGFGGGGDGYTNNNNNNGLVVSPFFDDNSNDSVRVDNNNNNNNNNSNNNTNTTDDDDTFYNATLPPTNVTNDDEIDNGDNVEFSAQYAGFGLFRYTLPIDQDEDGDGQADEDVCYGYTFETSKDVPNSLQVSRAGAVIGSSFGALGLLLLSIEFFCIRFVCSIPLIVTSFVLAALGWIFAFVIYTSDKCHPAGGGVGDTAAFIYNCQLGHGGVLGIIAFGSYMIAAVMTCFVPKTQPVLRMLREMEFDDYADPCDCCCCYCPTRFPKLHSMTSCCCLCNRKRNRKEEHDGDGDGEDNGDEEETPLIILLDDVEVDGQIYKQYHDETAGITLQNQYTAAYNRWLVSEQDYDKVLDRFKGECEDMSLNWRLVRMANNGVQEHGNGDEELARLVSVLNTLRVKCEQAKRTMELIGYDLEANTWVATKGTGKDDDSPTDDDETTGGGDDDHNPESKPQDDVIPLEQSVDYMATSQGNRVSLSGDATEAVWEDTENSGASGDNARVIIVPTTATATQTLQDGATNDTKKAGDSKIGKELNVQTGRLVVDDDKTNNNDDSDMFSEFLSTRSRTHDSLYSF